MITIFYVHEYLLYFSLLVCFLAWFHWWFAIDKVFMIKFCFRLWVCSLFGGAHQWLCSLWLFFIYVNFRFYSKNLFVSWSSLLVYWYDFHKAWVYSLITSFISGFESISIVFLPITIHYCPSLTLFLLINLKYPFSIQN